MGILPMTETMSLSFLHGGIAWLGLAAASIPVILHLLLRQRPRPIVFPALRLIRKRYTSTVRRLRLRQLLLLAMRVALILLLGLALGRPTLHSALFSIDQKAPVAAMLVFDDSLSMQYKHHGQSRLEKARALAALVLQRMPEDSELSIIESSKPATNVPLGLSACLSQLKSLEPQPAPRPHYVLNDALRVAYKGLLKSRRQRREVYLFTDMTASSWDLGEGEKLAQLAGLIQPGVRVYIINVGVKEPENIALGELRLSQQVLPAGTDLELAVSIRNHGPAADRVLELSVLEEAKAGSKSPVGANPVVIGRDNKPVHLRAKQATEMVLKLTGLTQGVHQGQVAINAGDPMPFDDVRYFTVEVLPPIRTLVVADRPGDALNWKSALAPESLRQKSDHVSLEVVSSEVLAETELGRYAVVCLLNVPKLAPAVWIKLANFVADGGGLFVALGEAVDPVSYQSEAALAVLPARLTGEVRNEPAVVLAPDDFSHPVLAKFKAWRSDSESELANRPVRRHWKVEPRAGVAVVVIRYSNNDPALVERTFGAGKRGRVLLLTTAAHYRPSADTWTELPLSWVYLVLAEQITRYLGGVTDAKLNYLAGSNVTIALDPAAPFSLFSYTDPRGHVERLSVESGKGVLEILAIKLLGHYRVDSTAGGKFFKRGFSVNEPMRESELEPVDAQKLAELVGQDRLAIVADPDALEAAVDEGRVGRELFAAIMFLVITLICFEGYFANRFYKAVTPNAGLRPVSPTSQ